MKKFLSLLLVGITLLLSSCTNQSEKKVNPLDLGDKTYSQIIDLLGKEHSEPDYYEGGVYISYNNGYHIFFDAEDTKLKSSNKVTALLFTDSMDVYKGISVGKALSEINRNTALSNRLSAVANPESGGYYATAKFKHNNKELGIAIEFDDCMVCNRISIFFNKQDEYSKSSEI